ncbi:hypothetical protein ACE41H_24645 [Paenibacillus enshidis]|uniref:Uncharacterized protein n=1 Tax=Paenibacillus enshidis TaxID=1458439 RepID=A0ABV5B0Z8_9BACL
MRFSRATHLVLFGRDEDEIKRGETIVKSVMTRLRLELSPEKTKTLQLKEQITPNGRTIPELEYLGVAIQGWFQKRDGAWSFGLRCTPEALKNYREAIKEKTPKSLTLSLVALTKKVNPIILGKANHWAQAAKAVQTYREIKGQCRCATTLLGRQVKELDTYVRQRIRRCKLSQRGGSKTYRRTQMLSLIYTHERLIGAGLRYAERIIQDAATGKPLSDSEYLSIIRKRRAKHAAGKQRSKANDKTYWERRAAAYERAKKRAQKFRE